MKNRWLRPAAAVLLLALSGCSEPQDDADVVARVDDHTLTVDQVVELLVDEESLAADVGVISQLASYWIDYILLAEAIDADTTFADLDLSPLVEAQLWRTMVSQLRDSVMQVDTFISNRELEQLYAEDETQVEVRARHIMLGYPVQATAEQRDSVRAALAGVRQRIAGGASFETLAQQISQDPASARLGGDLGYFRRGDMVAPFENAAFALEPGEVSDVVETPMGLHLIRVDDRRTPGFEQIAAELRASVQARRVVEAESTFVAALETRVAPDVAEGAVEATHEMARNPQAGLSRRAAGRALVSWTGGEVTAGEVQTILRSEPPQLRNQLLASDAPQVELFLMDLARRELLSREAETAGLRPSEAAIDSLVADAAGQLRNAARSLGFFDIDQAPGEPRGQAIERAVEEALTDNLNGATQFVPLGLVSFQLRDEASYALLDPGIGDAIVRIAQVRANRALAPSETPTADPDTIGP